MTKIRFRLTLSLLMFLAAPISATGCIAAVDNVDQSEAHVEASESLSTCTGGACAPKIVIPIMRRDPLCAHCVGPTGEFALDPDPMVRTPGTAGFPPAPALKPFLATR